MNVRHGGTEAEPNLIEQEPVFSAPWQARAFSLTVILHHAGHLDWREWSSAFGAEANRSESDMPESHDYYSRWLQSLERLLTRKGLISAEQLRAEERHLRIHWPHPEHVARREPIARSLPLEAR